MWTVVDSPVGELRLVGDRSALNAIDFAGADARAGAGAGAGAGTRAGADVMSVRSSVAHHRARLEEGPAGERADDDPLLREAAQQLAAYFSRQLKDFDLPLAPHGSTFQLRVWEQLRAISYGETATYGEIAGRLGMTGHGARAVGLANGRNPLPIVVPCHRVVGADGSLTGYGGGIDRKRTLLDLERGALF